MAAGCLTLFSLAFLIFVIDTTTQGLLTNYVAFLPYDVIKNIELWRLPFSFLFNSTFTSFIFSYIFAHNLLSEFEAQKGTLIFLFGIMIWSFVINCVIGAIYYFHINQYLFVSMQPQNGVWNLFFFFCAKKLFAQSNIYIYRITRLFNTQVHIQNLYVLLIMLAIFVTFIDPVGPLISTILGLIVGIIFKGRVCQFNFIRKIEYCFRCCITQNFIRYYDVEEEYQTEILKLGLDSIQNFFLFQKEQKIQQSLELGGVNRAQAIPNVDKMLQYSQE